MCQKDTDIVRWISWPVWSKGPVYQSEKLSFYLTTEINAQVLSFPGSQFTTSIKWEQRDWLHLLAGILGRIKLHRVKKRIFKNGNLYVQIGHHQRRADDMGTKELKRELLANMVSGDRSKDA